MMDHKNSYSASYAAAGVDITAGYRAVELMKKHISRTRNEGCLDDVGGFGGCFGLPIAGMEEPVLVSGTDGCGTKVKLAILMDKHDTIGIDAVAMCVNDIICVGAKPLFFLDYIACGKNIPEKIAEIVGGVAEGCVQSGAALIGGETAEHPGMMPAEDYDLAGFAVGIVDKKKILNNTRMAVGDVVIALPSTGIHSNGFSLCRKVFDIDNNNPEIYVPRQELDGKSIAEALLVPTKIYVKPVLALLEKVDVKGISHITGGGFYENIPRSIPDGLCARIDKAAVKVLPIFDVIAKWGNIPERDMYNTYNMGVGMSVVVPAAQVETALDVLKANGVDAYVIGEIIQGQGEEKVIL
ncbi:MAG: phosphoribosylformylglycinamidine cyclo-ligase [Clostridiales bacterium]|nr:phosphoribosylformylglycinamidine cyclo-ligase [Clostridiales bacterium]